MTILPYPTPTSLRVKEHTNDLDLSTRWWSDYPALKFSDLARPQATFDGYISDVYQRPKKLMRSASASNLCYIREAQPAIHPIQKSPSVSDLSPSHALSYYDRVAYRYIPSVRAYKPEGELWYNKCYAPAAYVETRQSIRRPLYPVLPYTSDYTPHYTYVTHKRPVTVPPTMASYVDGAMRYLNRYMDHEIKRANFGLQFTHNSYDHNKASNHMYNRHMLRGSGVFVSPPVGVPRYFRAAYHPLRVYTLSHRVLRTM